MTPERAIYLLKELLKEAAKEDYIDTGDVIEIIDATELPGKSKRIKGR